MFGLLAEWTQCFGFVLVVIQGFEYWELSIITLIFVVAKKLVLLWNSRTSRRSVATQTLRLASDKETQTDPKITKNLYGVVYHGPGGGKRQIV